ncbi:LysM peptidoglycan-binding domain-containing protein [Streptacidiphilus sp. P02-A3a]|uniref:LysM peptidoglycan-binding domain-containing protein n=1 Tax=Streptacidiphilus sp. P02-A3a TaxID=2704468 RepID=UPI0015FCAC26|nr:LysM peptidoglycan-binding domain-containing protein [Streptacidiphilus sp. P02-A3a]QMU68879.1 LysM peptidoglycan-binding domain-containing protein [Streptacidiphilus sp. P02-A3a]
MSTARHRRPPTPVLTPQRAALGALAATGAGAALPLAAAATPAAAAAPAHAAHAAPAHPAAAHPAGDPAAGAVHVVRTGENLTEIAGALSVGGGWPSIYQQNRAVIGPDPNLIRPGERLRIPMTRATTTRPAPTPTTPAAPVAVAASAPTRTSAPTSAPARTTATATPLAAPAPPRTSAPAPTPTRTPTQASAPTHAPAPTYAAPAPAAPAPTTPAPAPTTPAPAPTTAAPAPTYAAPAPPAPAPTSAPGPVATPQPTTPPAPAAPTPPSAAAAIWYTAPDGTRQSTTVLPSAANPQRVFYYVSTPPDPTGPLRVATIPAGGGKDGYGVSWQLAPSGETYQPVVGVYSQGPFGLFGHASYVVGLAHDQQVSLNWTSAANLTSP